MKCLSILAVAIGACGVLMAADASAATDAKTFYMDPAAACQLSIPTVDTAVRPRATGYRNEGDSAAFMICGLPYYYSGAVPTSFSIVAVSFDGASHTFNCTGVTRFSSGQSPAFVTKSVTTPAGGSGSATWTSADLTMGNFDASITCPIPPGVAITSVQIVVNDEIGT
jgi:hypothetical protein